MKRIVVFFLIMSLIFSNVTVSAASILVDKINVLGESIEVDGRLTDASECEKINYIIIKKGFDAKIDKVYAAREILTALDGTFSIEETFPVIDAATGYNMPDGIYLLRIGSNEVTPYEFEFEYVYYLDALTAIKACKSEDEMVNAFKNDSYKKAFEFLGFQIELINANFSDNEKTDLYKQVYNGLVESEIELGEAEIEEIRTVFMKKLSFKCINKKINGYLEIFNPKYSEVYYSDLTNNALKSWLNSKIYSSVYSNETELEERYSELNIIYGLKTSGVGALYDKIIECAEVSGIGNSKYYSVYVSMSETQKNMVASNMIKSLSKSREDTYAEAIDAFENSVKEVGTSKKDSGGGSGGGSSGRGGLAGPMLSVNVKTPEVKTPTVTNGYLDLQNVEWAAQAIMYLTEKNIVSGVGGNMFEPNAAITREEAVKIIVNALEINVGSDESDFKDVEKDEWYYPYVSAAYKAGITDGIGNSVFGVGLNITRQDMATMIFRAINERNISVPSKREYTEFLDQKFIDDYASKAVNYLYCAGIINGAENRRFCPKEYCTRAETAKMIYELVKDSM